MGHSKNIFQEFLGELKHIVKDVFFAYKHFLHWNISKICIFIGGILLGILLSLPVFLITVCVAFLDPIDWNNIIQYALYGKDQSYNIITNLAEHPFWFVFMLILLGGCALLFILSSAYTFFLFLRLYFGYIEREKIKFLDNAYFSKKYIPRFLALISWNLVYLLAPFFIIFSIILGLYLLSMKSIIPFLWGTYSISAVMIVGLMVLFFLSYKLIFGYCILALHKKDKKFHTSREYIQKSCEKAKWKHFWKFLFLVSVYMLLLTPFKNFEGMLESQSQQIQDAIIFKSGKLDTINPENVKYYEYITKEYKDATGEELVEKLGNIKIYWMIYQVFYFLFFYSLFILLIASFYKRVIEKD